MPRPQVPFTSDIGIRRARTCLPLPLRRSSAGTLGCQGCTFSLQIGGWHRPDSDLQHHPCLVRGVRELVVP
jgi:hypothetical protein